jgi:hypothetical protein
MSAASGYLRVQLTDLAAGLPDQDVAVFVAQVEPYGERLRSGVTDGPYGTFHPLEVKVGHHYARYVLGQQLGRRLACRN